MPPLIAEPETNVSEKGTGHADSVVAIRNLTVVYPGADQQFVAVNDVTIAVYPRQIVGIVGESGAGKSTVGAAILQLLDRPGRITGGSILLGGDELVGMSEGDMCRVRRVRIGSIFQDPLTALCPVLTIGFQLCRAIELSTNLRGSKARERAIHLLSRMNIADPEGCLKRYPHQLSGGMRQRVVIAIALSGDPDLVIADEPTTALDVSVQSEILILLRELCLERDVGVLLITHDMAVISEVTDRIVVMRNGRIVEQGSTRNVLSAPIENYTRLLIEAVPRVDIKLERFIHLNDADRAGAAPGIADATPEWYKTHSLIERSQTLIQVNGLSVTYATPASLTSGRKSVKAVDDVSFFVRQGQIFGIVGESGSGKSTIARVLCGLESLECGTVTYKGLDISNLVRDRQLRKSCLDMQMIFQDPYASLDPRQRVDAILSEPLRVHGLASRQEIPYVIEDVLGRVGLSAEDGRKYPHQFSGGQRQRISIARALVMQPRLLICDEPTSALDVSVQAQILNLLRNLRDDLDLTIIFISHNLAVVRQMCDYVVVMNGGRVCEAKQADELFEDPTHAYTKHLLQVMPKFVV